MPIRRAYGVTRRVTRFVTLAARAEIVTLVEALTVRAVTGNVAVRLPARTVTVGGTVATEVLPEESVTTVPPASADPFRVTVPTEVHPLATDVGATVSDSGAGPEVTARLADRVEPPPAALMEAGVVVPATAVEMVKVADLEPAATVTLPGTAAAEGLLLERVTRNPLPAAAALRVTVPAARPPPGTLGGVSARPETLSR